MENNSLTSLSFLMCSERSGSNFISKFLNGHPDICGPSAKHIINPVARNLFRYGDLSNPKNWDMLLEDIHYLISVNFSIWKREFSFSDLQKLAVAGDIKSLIKNIFLGEARANGKQHVFIKENHVYEFLPFLLVHFPEAKFVYQTRDPRDMALSWKENVDHQGGVIRAARQWKQDQQQNLKNFQLLNVLGKVHFLTYEQLVDNSETEIRKILAFLGVPFDSSIFDFYKDEITKKNADMQKGWKNLSQGVIKNNSRRYLKSLTEDEVKAIEKICFYEMKSLGYDTEYSIEELSIITGSWLEKLNKKELSEFEYSPSEGIKSNMIAKSKFYQR